MSQEKMRQRTAEAAAAAHSAIIEIEFSMI